MIHAAIASLGFLVLLLIIYLLHARFFLVDVVFYAALQDVAFAVLLASSVLWLSRHFANFTLLEKVQLVAIWLLTGYALAISVPTIIDRSLSFYILEKLAQRGGSIRADAFPGIFANEYMKEHHLVEVRLTEQIESGTISIAKGCVRLTDKGRLIASFSRDFRTHFLPKHRLLMGEYTDDLTDPFRRSADQVNYLCDGASSDTGLPRR